jgi:hypothetical protein
MQDVHPSIWGGDAWRFLHTLAGAYPTDPDTVTRRGMFDLVKALTVVLPCGQCRGHLSEFMIPSGLRSPESPPMLSGVAFRSWLNQAHINANKQRDDQLGVTPPTMVAVATGASVVVRPVIEAKESHGQILDSMFATDAITHTDEKRQRGLAISFYIITPVLLGMFVTFVVINWRR